MLRKWFSVGLFVAVLSVIPGCGQQDEVALLPVSGKVTLDGKPLDRAEVTYVPQKGRPSVAVTDAQGVYTLRYTSGRDGALPGTHTVMITSAVTGFDDESTGKSVPGRKEVLPDRYHSKSSLSVVVSKDAPSYDFDLTSK